MFMIVKINIENKKMKLKKKSFTQNIFTLFEGCRQNGFHIKNFTL